MKKITHLIWLFFAVGCIPLEDVLPPTINIEDNGNVSVKSFEYQDSIVMEVFYRDNSALKQWRVDIEPLQVKSPKADWRYSQTVGISGGPRATTVRVVVPIPARSNNEYISTGKYELTLTLFDLDSNRSVHIDTFNVIGDVREPDFLNLSTSMSKNIPIGAPDGTQYWACPGQPIKFFGKIADKTKLRRVGFSYKVNDEVSAAASFPINTGRFEYDTVSLASYMNDSLQIIFPASLNDSTITLNLFVEDFFGRRRDTTFNVFVRCDVQAPTITLESASKMPINGIAYVVENTDFVIYKMRIKDNEALKEAVVKFGKKGQPFTSSTTFNLSGKNDSISLTVSRALLTLGETYQFYVAVTDMSTVLLPGGNLGVLSFEIQVVQDAPPTISFMDFYVNKGTPQEQKFAGAVAGSTITISGIIGKGLPNNLIPDGKGEDDVAISRLVMRWTDPDGKIFTPVAKNMVPPVSVLKFTDHASPTAFLFTKAGTYKLEIVMTDTKGQAIPTANRVYTFVVVN